MDFANLYCRDYESTMAKELKLNQSCDNSQQLQYNLPLQYGIVLQSKLQYSKKCYNGTGISGGGSLSNTDQCLSANSQKFKYNNGNQDCGLNDCVSIQCYTASEYENKLNQDAPQLEDHNVHQMDDGVLLYYSIQNGYSFLCSSKKYDLNENYDVLQGDILCQNMGYDYMESMEQVNCDYNKYYYVTIKKGIINCPTLNVENINGCTVKLSYKGNCSGFENKNNNNCISLNCKNKLISTLALVLIIVASSIIFIIILICIIRHFCCNSKNQQNEKPQQVKKFTVKQPQSVYISAAKIVKQKRQNNNSSSNNDNQHPNPTYGNQFQNNNINYKYNNNNNDNNNLYPRFQAQYPVYQNQQQQNSIMMDPNNITYQHNNSTNIYSNYNIQHENQLLE